MFWRGSYEGLRGWGLLQDIISDWHTICNYHVVETNIRRIVLRHTAGPYAGLRQIIGCFGGDVEIPEVIPAHPQGPAPLWPDGRLAKALRLKSTDRYVLYTEQIADEAAA